MAPTSLDGDGHSGGRDRGREEAFEVYRDGMADDPQAEKIAVDTTDIPPTNTEQQQTSRMNETEQKINNFLSSRYVGGAPNNLPALPPVTKLCNGACNSLKIQQEFSITQWNISQGKGSKSRYCLVCSRANTSTKRKGQVTKQKMITNQEFGVAAAALQNKKKATRKKRKQREEEDDDGLPPLSAKRGKDGISPVGRIRSCMCSTPTICRELMWRWARLQEGKYINYVNLPTTHTPGTIIGKHVTSYRQAVLRNLGYMDSEEGQTITRIKHLGKKNQQTTEKMNKEERIAFVHFHPDVIPFILEEHQTQGMNKINKFRIPMELGRRTGLKAEDKCPVKDSNDVPSFYALPNYSLDLAHADVTRAEEQYRQSFKAQLVENAKIASEMQADPSKYIMELHDLKQRNSILMSQNEQLVDKLKREQHAKAAIEKKNGQLQKGLEKMTRRVQKWELTKDGGRVPKSNAKDLFKDITGQDLREEGFVGSSAALNELGATAALAPVSALPPTRHTADNTLIHTTSHHGQGKGHGKGGKRWSDQRMDRAVEAIWQDPTLTAEEALRVGGFEYPLSDETNKKQTNILDADQVSLAQRKNNLYRRVRKRKQTYKSKSNISALSEVAGEMMDQVAGEMNANQVAEEALEEPSMEDLV